MRTQEQNVEEFRSKLKKFLESNQEVDNFMELFVAFRHATMIAGASLSFSTVEEVLKEELSKKG